MTCPNCLAAMTQRTLERTYGSPVSIDVCDHCQGFWFDGQEMLQLSPGGTLDLFRHIQEHASGARQPLSPRITCPRCRAVLTEAHDLQRNTRFTYFKCPAGHGRYVTYFQFLRAKNFVRTLSAKEVDELRRHVRQVNCTNCGAPVDVERNAACAFCRTPVSILDPDQLVKAVSQLKAAEPGRQQIDPAWPLLMEAERRRAERAFADTEGWGRALAEDASPDLVALWLRALASLWK